MPPLLLLTLALIAAPIVAFAAVRWRRPLVYALPYLVVLNGVPLVIRGTSLRLDQLAACLLVIPLFASVISGRARLRMDATTLWIAAILVANIVSSVLHSPAQSYSLSQCANLASAWIIYVILVNFLDSREEVLKFFSHSLRAATIAIAVGILAFVLASFGLSVGGAEVSASAAENLTKPYGAYGTLLEPNIFGSFSGAFLVLAVALLTVAPTIPMKLSRTAVQLVAGVSAGGLLFSFTRSAWLATMIGILCVALIGRKHLGVRTRRIVQPLLLGLALVALMLLLPGPAGTFLRFKLANVVNVASRTATLRLLSYGLAFDQYIAHPIIGWGTFSFAPLVAQGTDFARFEGWRSLWIGNYLLLALHDTGAIGLALWIVLIWSIVSGGVRSMVSLSRTEPEIAARVLGLTCGTISLLIAFLATSGFSLGFPWLFIGLLGAHRRLAHPPAAT